MLTLILAVLAGFLACRLAWIVLRATLARPLFARENYRGRVLPTAVGVVFPVAVLMVEAARVIAGAIGIGDPGLSLPRVTVLVLVVGLALLGFLDDVAGTGEVRGFRGHGSHLLRGRLTTGGLKLLGGAAIALVVCAPLAGPRVGQLLIDAGLVALAANLGNLLDRAPGRVLKAGLVSFLVLAIVASSPLQLSGVAVVIGASLALLGDDLHERLMLGDAGANVVGGVCGLGVVLACAPSTRLTVLIVVAILNLASELVSFSKVIAAVPPLRALDLWGRRP
jgi:UDP-GlcNAc:undecaprenyl-phosphate GlcNAc-1-phosphate transferase